MTIALIAVSPPAVIATWPSGPVNVNIPGLWQAEGVDVGYVTPDGAYKIVAATAFVPPPGQIITGAPSYAIDGNGVVTETYATQAAAAPIVTSAQFRGLFTAAEKLAITQAGETSAQIRVFMDDAGAAGEIDLGNAEVAAGINALVAAGILTQDRATAILAGQPPPP